MADTTELDAAAEFRVDLTNCDREPIHVPGAVQPHGALLVLRAGDLAVLQASENTGALFGVPAERLLGAPVSLLLGDGEAARLREVLERPDPAAANPLRFSVDSERGAAAWDGIVHVTGGGVVLELEPGAGSDPRSVTALYAQVRQALARLQSAGTLAELSVAIAEETRRITGLDRVMVYRFDPDWNGEVVAEARAEEIEGFMGMRFPASDIPAQARELYRRNWLRLIADSAYRPARIVPTLNPETGKPLDLSGSTLRSVSPIHLEYLRNMEVGASMSVSLLRGGELWGLVACHHATPRYVSYDVRTACEFLGQAFSVQLGAIAEIDDRAYELRVSSLGAQLLDRTAADEDDWVRALTEGTPSLADLAAAPGAAVVTSGSCTTVGETPSAEEILALTAWLSARDADLFHTEHLSRDFPAAESYAGVASGLLAAAVSRGRGDYLLWFRPEVVRTVEWAGNPEKPVRAAAAPPAGAERHADEVPTLSPRTSFAAWRETVRGRSAPWHPAEVRGAAELRGRIVEIVLRRADQLARLNAELTRSNDELDAFAYIVSHDLKEPLRGIHNFSRMLREDHGPALGDEGREEVETLLRLSARMDGMLDSLLFYSRAGKLELRLVETDLQALLDEVLDTLRTRLKESGTEIRVPRPLPTVRCDPVRAGSVLQNLISNAVKYNDKPEKWIEIGWREPEVEGGPAVLYVRDNGIGIPERHWDSIFRIFKRLHGRDRFGGGSGAGLTIARKLVERHGGRIWLESAPGEGSTFFFTLEPDPWS
ncbi:MAG TPA: ATP-binding protein [Longimicrobium sp.]|nr:ATP-binding protein [Longimicrobium sp.]